jgi:hypothetical protein
VGMAAAVAHMVLPQEDGIILILILRVRHSSSCRAGGTGRMCPLSEHVIVLSWGGGGGGGGGRRVHGAKCLPSGCLRDSGSVRFMPVILVLYYYYICYFIFIL